MPIMASFNNMMESPNSRKRKQELQYYSSLNDHKLIFDSYYEPDHKSMNHTSPFYSTGPSPLPSTSWSQDINDNSQLLIIQSDETYHHHQFTLDDTKRFLPNQIPDFDDLSSKQRHLLNLNDLETTKALHHQKDLIQAWTVGGSTNDGDTSTPGFFSPGFLESLQDDTNTSFKQSSSDLSFSFHSRDNDWNDQNNISCNQDDFILNPPLMVPERTVLSQKASTSSFVNNLQMSNNHDSNSSSPQMGTWSFDMSGIQTTTSSVSSNSSISSPPLLATYTSTSTTSSYMPIFNPIVEDDPWFTPQHAPPPPQRRMIKPQFDEFKMKSLIKDYLCNKSIENERTVIILTSKVAQKSYGTEKRFLCPPPTAILVGTNWWTKPNQQSREQYEPREILKLPHGEFMPPKLVVSISGETSTQSGQIDWYTVSGTTVGLTGHNAKSLASTATENEHPSRFKSSASESKNNTMDWYRNQNNELLAAGKCVSKHLFINDADEKRKRVEAVIRIQLANGIHLGAIASKGIKVISKPSKKRQSVKNLELCIHHGTTVSLFNRIRSQTVSTKYLGVSSSSSSLTFPGQPYRAGPPDDGTCFVARTSSWDPFIIWLVDTTQQHEQQTVKNKNYPPAPAIALKTNQLTPIHYNQHIVLQCLTTGLVSPVMIIRKVDKASTVVGGATRLDGEALGDPVSQLHKIALEIVQENHQNATYLACLNDMVGMHKTTEPRKSVVNLQDITSEEGGKVIRKRRVSTDLIEQPQPFMMDEVRRRVNSLNDEYLYGHPPLHHRKSSSSSNSSIPTGRRSSVQQNQNFGAVWQEDVSDASVWTIVGTDCETYTFLSPATNDEHTHKHEINNTPSTPFPSLNHFSTKSLLDHKEPLIHLQGENFSRDLQVWFGDIKSPSTEYRSRESILCQLPPKHELARIQNEYHQIPILLVKGDGTICKTNKFYPL